MSKYKSVSVASRTVDCSRITKEEFVEMMRQDIQSADRAYGDECYKWNFERLPARLAKYVESEEDKARSFAESKWKTEARREKYFSEACEEIKKSLSNMLESELAKRESLGFFDVDVFPEEMGISDACVLRVRDLSDKALEECFDIISSSKYFANATGWSLEYERSDESPRCAFRPRVKLTLSSDLQEEYDSARAQLQKKINNFLYS